MLLPFFSTHTPYMDALPVLTMPTFPQCGHAEAKQAFPTVSQRDNNTRWDRDMLRLT